MRVFRISSWFKEKPQPSEKKVGVINTTKPDSYPHLPAKVIRGQDAGRSPGSSIFPSVFPSRASRGSDVCGPERRIASAVELQLRGSFRISAVKRITEFPSHPALRGTTGICYEKELTNEYRSKYIRSQEKTVRQSAGRAASRLEGEIVLFRFGGRFGHLRLTAQICGSPASS